MIILISSGKHGYFWKELGTEIKYVQSAAILEIVHALIGFVRSPIARTLPQVFSRLAIVWLAMDPLYTLADPKVSNEPVEFAEQGLKFEIDRARRSLLPQTIITGSD